MYYAHLSDVSMFEEIGTFKKRSKKNKDNPSWKLLYIFPQTRHKFMMS